MFANIALFLQKSSVPGSLRVAQIGGLETVNVNTIISASAFKTRKNDYLDALINTSTYNDRLARAARALAILVRAEETGNMSKVSEANQEIVNTLNELPNDISSGNQFPRLYNGAGLSYIRTYMMYKDKPTLLYPSTKEKILNGGSTTSLRYYLAQICEYNGQGVNLVNNNPWQTTNSGTYNHQINNIAQGLLLSQIYEGETCLASNQEFPLKNNTDEGLEYADDVWHYWRNAFYKYLTKWGSAELNDSNFNKLIGEGLPEKDSVNYLPAYLSGFFYIRDFVSDPTIASYAEYYIDALMGDYIEDIVGDLITGSHVRTSQGYVNNLRVWYHAPLFHMWFGNVEYSLPSIPYANGNQLFPWGGSAFIAAATSDYNPSHPDFPRVLIEIARNKPSDGYLVTESIFIRRLTVNPPLGGERGNWVTPDYALRF